MSSNLTVPTAAENTELNQRITVVGVGGAGGAREPGLGRSMRERHDGGLPLAANTEMNLGGRHAAAGGGGGVAVMENQANHTNSIPRDTDGHKQED